MLSIAGSAARAVGCLQSTPVSRERHCGSFSRSMTLPAGVDPSKIEAKVKHGVAEVTIPLSAGSKKESVTINPIGG